MSEFLSVPDYQRELSTLDQMIEMEVQSAEHYGMDRATESAIRSLRNRRERLASELAALKDEELPGHELSIVLTGDPVRGHAIDAGFLGSVLTNLQDLLTSIVGSVSGSDSSSGRFSKEVRALSSLRLASVFESSFGMRLEATDESLQLDGSSPIAPAIESFVDLVDGGQDRDALMHHLAEVGGRAAGHYRSLLGQLSRRHASMRVLWPGIRGFREAALTSRGAERLVKSLATVVETTEGRYVWGVLDGAVKRREYFELRADDGELLSGSISSDIMQDLREYFDRRCRAYITTTTVTDQATGKSTLHHRLLELAEPDAPLFQEA